MNNHISINMKLWILKIHSIWTQLYLIVFILPARWYDTFYFQKSPGAWCIPSRVNWCARCPLFLASPIFSCLLGLCLVVLWLFNYGIAHLMIMRLVDLFSDFIAALNDFHLVGPFWKKKRFYDYIGINYHRVIVANIQHRSVIGLEPELIGLF